jgi:PAS domain S-box-containing protein
MAMQASTEELNPWEVQSLGYHYPVDGGVVGLGPGNDALIWPGLYSRSGLDVMNILVHVISRPNPKVDIGPVDCAVSLVICELQLPDAPIIYVSEGFTELTGYKEKDVLGKDCRLLQAPNGKVRHGGSRGDGVEKDKIKAMRRAVEKGDECQVKVVNYRKNGTKFTNLVTIIPVTFGPHQYLVGFHCEA